MSGPPSNGPGTAAPPEPREWVHMRSVHTWARDSALKTKEVPAPAPPSADPADTGEGHKLTREDTRWDPLPRGPGIVRLTDTGGHALGHTPSRSRGRQTHGHGRTHTGTRSHKVPGSSDSWTREDTHWDTLPRGPGVVRLTDTGGHTLGPTHSRSRVVRLADMGGRAPGPTPTRSRGRQTHGHGRTRTGTHSHEAPVSSDSWTREDPLPRGPGSSHSRTREDAHWDPLPRGPGSSDSRTQKDTHWDPLTRRPGVVRLMDTGGHILGPTPTQSWGRQTHNTGGHAVGPSHTRSQGRQTHRVDSGARAGGARGESVCNRTGSQCGKMERSGAGQWGQLQST